MDGAADGVGVAVGVAVDEPAPPRFGATTPGIGAAGAWTDADPAPVPAEVVEGAGARAGAPIPGMVGCPSCAAALGCAAAGCDGADADGDGDADGGDAAGVGVVDACADWGCAAWGCTDGTDWTAPSNRYRL
jgi:hypothetical protein